MASNRRPILVVDDDESIAGLVQLTLEVEGYNVVITRDARRALDLLDTLTPALILLDMRMPEMNGWEFIDAYRSRRLNRAPIVIMTAGRAGAVAAAEAQVDGAIDKPFDLDDLLMMVRKHSRGDS
jgi:DNA-binding response OmpR family regulator